MKRIYAAFIRQWLVALLIGAPGLALAGDYLSADQAFQPHASIDGQNLHLHWEIADGYYLYRDKYSVTSESESIELGPAQWPSAVEKNDPNFGLVLIDKHAVDVLLPIVSSQGGRHDVIVRYQGCAEDGLCYPPQTQRLAMDWPQVATQTEPVSTAVLETGEDQSIASKMAQKSSLWVLLSFFGFGVLLALTPCIFPMIPILSGIIVGSAKQMSSARALQLSIAYVIGMAVTYTLAGVAAALAGRNLQAAMQHPAILVTFSLLFVALALSMFDVFQLQLPSGLQSRLGHISRSQKGGTLGGAAVMGVLGALIVGPCVAPPLAGALLYIGQTGNVWLGGSALFSLGLGMGLPILVAGTTVGSVLPRAGHWMNLIKHSFGAVMLAMALLLLQRVLPGEAMMVLWACLLASIGVALGAMDFSGQRAGIKMLGQAAGVLLLVCAAIQLVGVSSGGTDPRLPLQLARSSITQDKQKAPAITKLADLKHVITAATKPVIVDFYADWCTACKDFERSVLRQPAVQQALNEFEFVTLDLTRNGPDAETLLNTFKVFGPPAILVFDKGTTQPRLRTIGEMDQQQFMTLLSKI